jgi:hypothetical protein
VPSGDRALQTAAVASWQRAGFGVLSVNAAQEIAALSHDYPHVTFITATATGERIAGKPVPYIHDLLKALRAACASHGTPLVDCMVGVINADIHLRLPDGGRAALEAAARNALLLGPRVDVPSAEALAQFKPAGHETYSVGYDYFLMSGNLLADFGDTPFCIGMPFWDYWMPLVALLKGRPLKTINAPVALHVGHETRWDNKVYVFFHAMIGDILALCQAGRGRSTADGRQFDLLYDLLGHAYRDIFARGTHASATEADLATLAAFYDRLQEVAVHHIKAHAVSMDVNALMGAAP